MKKEERIKLYKEALTKWGVEAQINMVYEEVGELITALSRIKRGRANHLDVLTELADVSIMIGQMATLMGYNDFEEEKENKLKKLKEKLNK